jgi:hypothetical protein
MVKSRREAYKAKDWLAYEQIVREMIELEDHAAQELLTKILDEIGLSEREFGVTH